MFYVLKVVQPRHQRLPIPGHPNSFYTKSCDGFHSLILHVKGHSTGMWKKEMWKKSVIVYHFREVNGKIVKSRQVVL